MIEDQGPPSYRSSAAPPPLLSRLALSAASSTTSLSNRENPPSSAEPSPSGGSEFFPNVATVAAPPDPSIPTSTPIAPIVRFPSLLPVLYYDADGRMLAVPGTAHTDHTGNVDFSDERFVLADGGITADGLPNWSTTLVRRERLLTEQAVEAHAKHLRISAIGLIFGERNGVLISPDMDPQTDKQVEELFTSTNPKRRPHAAAYIEHVRYTPPELRTEVHQRALERWPAIQAERNQSQSTATSRREPLPTTYTSHWKKWLQLMYKGNSAFKYPRIPRVGNGYQTMHIEGTKTLLKFLPLAPRMGSPHTPLRDAFLRVVAMLLCIPEEYTRVIDQLGVSIAKGYTSLLYTEVQYGSTCNIGTNDVARFLATTGTTSNEAEKLRPWAMAYIAMELESYPNSEHSARLQQARDTAHARIDSDLRWALDNIPLEAAGSYNPGLVQACAARQSQLQEEASSSTNAEVGPSTPTPIINLPVPTPGGRARSRSRHPDNADENTVTLEYEEKDDEDVMMGPA